MNAYHKNKKTKKAIAVTYSNHQAERFQRQQLIILLAAVCGLSLALLTAHAHAAPADSITIDMHGPVEIDYGQVDKFNQAADMHATKYAAQDGDKLIFSDKPVIIEKKLPKGYQPKSLVDLGVRVSISHNGISDNIIRVPTYTLVKDEMYLFSIPDVLVQEAGPVVTAASSNAPQSMAAPESKPGASDIANAATSAEKSSSQPANPIIESKLDISFWKIFASAGLILGALLLLPKSRKSRQPVNNKIYQGQPSANEMVGKGKLFDFNGNVLRGKVTPINTTFLNMLWHVGKFSKEGSMSTYFYMAYYIPPQQNYARNLQKQKIVKQEETHTD